jgi:hypothetical protein
MARDPYEQVQRALARQRAAAERDSPSRLDKYTRLGAANLTIDDLAQVVAEVIKSERADLVRHMHRLFQLTKAAGHGEDVRAENLHRRLTHLESVVRRMQKGGTR